MIGGYSLIDCKGLDVGINEKQTIPGLNAALSKVVDGDKPLILCNVLFEGDHATPVHAMATRRALGTIYVFTALNSFTVTTTDEATFYTKGETI